MSTDTAGSTEIRRTIPPTMLILGFLSAAAGTPGAMTTGGAAAAIEPPAVGSEFQINTYTSSYQIHATVAMAPGGDFVAVWASLGSSGSDSSFFSIQGQRFERGGEPLGSQFQINTFTPIHQVEPAVAIDGAGNFVAVWQSQEGSGGTDSDRSSIQAQRYAADGTSLGGEFQVNTYTTDNQRYAAVAAEPDGDFVVVWTSYGSAGTDNDPHPNNRSIQGQRYAADGTMRGGEFQVNTYTTFIQTEADVAVAADGSSVVVWESYESGGPDTDQGSIQGQRYAADGTPAGGEFQVNTYATSYQSRPAVAMTGDGGFVVVWESYGSSGSDTDGASIQGRRFAAAGAPIRDDFQLNSHTTDRQYLASVAVAPDGGFTAVWQSRGSGGSDLDRSIQGRRFRPNGSPVGEDFQINTYTTGPQGGFFNRPVVATDALGDLVVVWQSEGSSGTDTSSYSIQGQRFAAGIFGDGFESGDTSSWSRVVDQ